jgi:N-acetylglucosaminyldiphosphoundecaprenol N-acetyl-beta-D-mannosaminyltransferase
MQGSADAVASQTADLLRIIDLVVARPLDWQHVLRGICHQAILVTFVNPLSVSTVRIRPDFLDELASFDLVYADSILIAKLAAMLRGEPVERRSFDGNSMAPELFGLCRHHALRVALVGGRPGVATAAGRVFHRTFGTRPMLTAAGYFDDRVQRRNLLRTIERRAPEVVICGMGSGLQDRFLLDLAGEGWKGLGVTCGGYFDQVVASGVRYYPRFVDRFHLRALYRMMREPFRPLPRYTYEYSSFYRAALGMMAGRGLSSSLERP